MSNQDEIRKDIRKFIMDNFLYSDNSSELDNGFSLFDTSVIDSTGVLELLEFLEDHFDISIMDEEVIPDNMDSVNNIVKFIIDKITNK